MAKKKSSGTAQPEERPLLLIERSEAKAKIEAQIARGNQLIDRVIYSEGAFTEAQEDYFSWKEYVQELLGTLFSSTKFAVEFRGHGYGVTYRSLHEKIDGLKKDSSYHVRKLESIRDRLELIQEGPFITRSVVVSEAVPLPVSDKVFIVHGHDELAKQSVARFVEKFGLEVIILHEKADGGRTIIEKFEQSSDVGFAIILYTSDDLGNSKVAHSIDGTLKGRSRQNVVFEHGYFAGKLGRKNVIALLKGDVEIPSDLQGILYTTMDEHEAWKMRVAKEMKDAGLTVDLNKL